MAQRYNLMASWLVQADAARRLGPRAVGLGLWGKGPGRWWAGRRLGVAQIDPLAGADVRPGWEANRWTQLNAGAALAWMAANPPFAGPNWLCGQEAALRVLHLAATLPRPLPDWAGPMLAAHARRIAANPAYAMAQDNNHPISEAAGLLVCGMLLGVPGLAARGARRLDAAVARLVAPDGGFAQPSPAYHRLMVDVLVAVEVLRRHWGGPKAAATTRARAAAATDVLRQFTCPQSGALPRIGHQDGSAFDGSQDARGSLARAEAMFGAAPARQEWRCQGFAGWSQGGARAILRNGGRFRPAHADFLHLDLWDGPLNLLRDGGTGAYNPDPENAWWLGHFWSVAAHNTVQFDDQEPMPRVSRFLHARWPDVGADWVRDWRGRRHSRHVEARGREWRVTDRLDGPFQQATLRWRLAPGDWRLTADGVEGSAACIRVTGTPRLEQGWESLAYGQVTPCPVLVSVLGPAASAETLIQLPLCGRA